MMDNIKIDLFKLIGENNQKPGSWVMARGEKLNKSLELLISRSVLKLGSKRKLVRYLQVKFEISQATSARFVFLMKNWHPLFLIRELANLTNISHLEIQKDIDFLKMNWPPLKVYKAVKVLTIDLCKIAGSHAADGTVYKNFFRISDGHKSNIIAFRKWLENTFGVTYPIRQTGKNEWCVEFHSGIIVRYLSRVFSFPDGMKQYSVSEPETIKKSSLRYRKYFALGALTFESGITVSNQVGLCVSSKEFRDSIAEILTLLGVPFVKMEKQSCKYWRLWSKNFSKDNARKWLSLFEKETEKWFKLRDYVYGYHGKVESFNDAIRILDFVYPYKSSSKICMKNVLRAIKNLNKTHRYELVSYLRKSENLESYGGKWASSISHYLKILKNTNILKVEKGRFGPKKSFGTIIRDIYIYNPNITEWNLPYRPYLKGIGYK